jgi:hypothetical protein
VRRARVADGEDADAKPIEFENVVYRALHAPVEPIQCPDNHGLDIASANIHQHPVEDRTGFCGALGPQIQPSRIPEREQVVQPRSAGFRSFAIARDAKVQSVRETSTALVSIRSTTP